MRVSLDQLRQRVVDEIYVLSIFEVRSLQKVSVYWILQLAAQVKSGTKNCALRCIYTGGKRTTILIQIFMFSPGTVPK